MNTDELFMLFISLYYISCILLKNYEKEYYYIILAINIYELHLLFSNRKRGHNWEKYLLEGD